MYKDVIVVLKVEYGEKELFELLEWWIVIGIFKLRLVFLYCLLYFEEYFVFMVIFFSEFLGFMEFIILVLELFIILGDFNIYVDCGSECNDVV